MTENEQDKRKFALDYADEPDEVIHILRSAANLYHESGTELDSAHQDKSAGKPWHVAARMLDATADKYEQYLRRIGFFPR